MISRHRATLAGFCAVLLWSSLAVLTTATAGIPPFELLALGFAIAGVAGCAWMLRPGGPGVAALKQPAAAAVLGIAALFGYHALYFVALKNAPTVEANLLNYLWPLLIVVFAALLGGTRVRGGQWLGTALGLAAAVLLVSRGGRVAIDPAYVPGYLAALGAALIWSLYSVLNRRFATVASTAIYGACLAVGALGAVAHLAFETTVAPSPLQWLAIAAIGLGPTGIAFLLWDVGTKKGDIAVLGTLSYAAPLLSTGWLLLFGRGEPHWTQGVAVALLLFGAWLSMRGAGMADESAGPLLGVRPKNYRRIVLYAVSIAENPVVLMDRRAVTDMSENGPVTQRGIAACRNLEVRDGDIPVLGFHDSPAEMWMESAVAQHCAANGWLRIERTSS